MQGKYVVVTEYLGNGKTIISRLYEQKESPKNEIEIVSTKNLDKRIKDIMFSQHTKLIKDKNLPKVKDIIILN